MPSRTKMVEYEENPSAGVSITSLVVFVGVVAYAWDQNWLKLQETLGLPFWKKNGGASGGGASGGGTSDKAAAVSRARAEMAKLDPRWASASDSAVIEEVCRNATIFVGDKDLRHALGCTGY